MSAAKNILAILFGTMVSLVVLAAIECFLRAAPGDDQPYTFTMTERYISRDRDLGFRFAPNVTTMAEKFKGNTVVYSATYSSDRYGRRITPGRSESAPEEFVIFFGDSMSFGEGLQADETLPYFFTLRASGMMPYNYAFPGYGPQQMYVQISDPDFIDEISEKKGIAIYGYFDYHINRIVGSTEVLRWNPGYHPYFELEDGVLVHKGDFLTGRSKLTAAYLQVNQFRIFRALGLEFPVITTSHKKLLCEIIRQSQQEFERTFPGSRFVVALYPLSSKTDNIVQTCFIPNRIAYVDLRDAFGIYSDIERKDNPYRLGDGHFNKAGAALVASSLYRGLVKEKHLGELRAP